MLDSLKIGQVVRSKCGRDVGKYFCIKDIVDLDYVYIVDGKTRKLDKPKKKKTKHLIFLNRNAFDQGTFEWTNKNLRNFLNCYNGGTICQKTTQSK